MCVCVHLLVTDQTKGRDLMYLFLDREEYPKEHVNVSPSMR